MQTLVVLFNLKPGTDASAYESWARQTDLPIVRDLPSVGEFHVYRTSGLFGSNEPAPYDYVEVIHINDTGLFRNDVGTDTMRRVAGEFRQFADSPVFMLTDRLD